MNKDTKELLDRVSDNLYDLRKNNTPTYWITLIFVGMLMTSLIIALLKTTGIVVLCAAAFTYIFNNILNAYIAMRVAELSAEKAKVVAAAKAAVRPVKKP